MHKVIFHKKEFEFLLIAKTNRITLYGQEVKGERQKVRRSFHHLSFNVVYFAGMLGLAKRGNTCKNGDTFLSLTKFLQWLKH